MKWLFLFIISFTFAFTKHYLPPEWHYLWGALAGNIMAAILIIDKTHKPFSQLALKGVANAIKERFYQK